MRVDELHVGSGRAVERRRWPCRSRRSRRAGSPGIRASLRWACRRRTRRGRRGRARGPSGRDCREPRDLVFSQESDDPVGKRAVAGEVAGADDPVGAQDRQVRPGQLEADRVAVDVGDDARASSAGLFDAACRCWRGGERRQLGRAAGGRHDRVDERPAHAGLARARAARRSWCRRARRPGP